MFASRNTRVLEIPGESGETATIRRLSWKQLREARESVERKALLQLKEMGGAAVLRELRAGESATPPAEPAAADPFLQYDPEILLKHGITALSGVQRITADVLADLEAVPAAWLARQIFEFSTSERTEEQAKNV